MRAVVDPSVLVPSLAFPVIAGRLAAVFHHD
jgi:hypothetical protein